MLGEWAVGMASRSVSKYRSSKYGWAVGGAVDSLRRVNRDVEG